MKFELTDEFRVVDGVKFYHIRYLVDVKPYVKVGDVTGWIQSEDNLSDYDNSVVLDNACVGGRVKVSNNSVVSGNAYVFVNGRIYYHCDIGDDVVIKGSDVVIYDSKISGNVVINHVRGTKYRGLRIENAMILDDVYIGGSAQIIGRNERESVVIRDKVSIIGQPYIKGWIQLRDMVSVSDDVKILSKCNIGGRVVLNKDMVVNNENMYV